MSKPISVAEYKRLQGKKGRKRATPEHDQQVALFEWAMLMSNKIPELALMFAIPNGAFYGRYWSVAKRMKAEGVKKGVPDIFLPVPMMRTDKDTSEITSMEAGLWIEMKAGKNRPSEAQKWWIEKLNDVGYSVAICYSFEEAKKDILTYLDLKQYIGY